MSLVKRLKEFALFEEFSDAELRQISVFIEEVEFEDGHTILAEDSGSQSLYFILSGKVKIIRKIVGKTNIYSQLGANDVFGEVSFADQGPRTASALADGKVTVGMFAYEHFDVIKKQDPALGMKFLLQMMRALAKKFRAVNKSIDHLMKDLLGKTH